MQNEALLLFAEMPPTYDSTSKHCLQRVDITIQYYEQATGRRSTLFFLEAKGTNVDIRQYREVERQGQDACEAYLNNDQTNVHIVYALCTVGTRARLFRYTLGDAEEEAWELLWGESTELDPRAYCDAAHP